MTLQYGICGSYAYLITRTCCTLAPGEELFLQADTGEGSTLCLMGVGTEPTTLGMDKEGKAAVSAKQLPAGQIRVLFVQGDKTYDGGLLSVRQEADGSRTVLPAIGAAALELETFSAMLAAILARLKVAETAIDRLQNGPDVLA
ncbi:MAG: hypothetical protein IJY42_03675 [Clostridia bacterium]|nr:hypothetical protein [Clostridia bacterium]